MRQEKEFIMPSGKILIFDDDKEFVDRISRLLTGNGYTCEAVNNTKSAWNLSAFGDFDLVVISDEIKGRDPFKLIRTFMARDPFLTVILTTTIPAVENAIACMNQPFFTCLIKPLKEKDLVKKVDLFLLQRKLLQRFHNYKDSISVLKENSPSYDIAADPSVYGRSAMSVNNYFNTAFSNIFKSISNLDHMIKALLDQGNMAEPCSLLNCPRLVQLTRALEEAIAVLEETKVAFKSPQLGKLRHKLETILGKRSELD
jgi:CheY-like chemotaxis protein